ncbi:hypothetical protein TNCV_408041 [Trichonephila clavipes]|nr:hypothetical protein TNCV_408041 [Trichonephila clavipes]
MNLDQAPQDINKEFQLENVCLQAFVAETDPGCKKELISPGFLNDNGGNSGRWFFENPKLASKTTGL